jgi:hypothetical protein
VTPWPKGVAEESADVFQLQMLTRRHTHGAARSIFGDTGLSLVGRLTNDGDGFDVSARRINFQAVGFRLPELCSTSSFAGALF